MESMNNFTLIKGWVERLIENLKGADGCFRGYYQVKITYCPQIFPFFAESPIAPDYG